MEKGITVKPPIIDLIAVCFLLAPLMFVLYQFTFSGYNYMNFHRWQWLLTAPNAVFLFSSLVISYAVFTARFWGWLLAVAFQGALFFSSFWTLFMVQTEVTY
ncbi:MAG: hypothetical protein GY866_29615, partial [Proteobacteria bacterium]|nr:hypothetical protein [Pseudomonadota bacterium]